MLLLNSSKTTILKVSCTQASLVATIAMLCLLLSDIFWISINPDLPGHLQMFSPQYNKSHEQQSNQKDT